MLKQNKGITLVALVITIIVLLILAGVSISLVVGDNGVLTQASNASKNTDVAKAKEAVEQAVSSCQGDFVNTWSSNTTSGFIANFLTKDKIEEAMGGSTGSETYGLTYNGAPTADEPAETEQTGTITVNGVTYTFTLTQTSNLLGATIGWDK